jgi:beta-aspartyl-dipeptidase (metallo-type)
VARQRFAKPLYVGSNPILTSNPEPLPFDALVSSAGMISSLTSVREARVSGLFLLRDAELFVPEARGRGDVLVGGGSILAVGPSLPVPDPSLCEVIELGGARLIPGLIDAHVHLTGGGGESGPSSRVPRLALSSLTSAGVTSVVGLLGTDGTTRTMASLVAAALGLREEGLSAYCWTGSYELPLQTLTGSVRRDLVFVDPILGVGELALSDHRSSQPTLDELLRVASDCHVGGMMSGKAGVLHLHLGDGPRGLDLLRRSLEQTELPARVFHPTHVNRQPALFAEALELAARGVTVDVTAFPVEEGEAALSAADAIVRFLESGLPLQRLTCSSDGGGCLPTFDAHGHVASMGVGSPSALAQTLAELLGRGQGLERVLPLFTSNVASLLRLGRKGGIAPGMDADLVVLDAEHRVRDVMARGRFHLREGRALVRGMFE